LTQAKECAPVPAQKVMCAKNVQSQSFAAVLKEWVWLDDDVLEDLRVR